MATGEDLSKRRSEICRRIEELKASTSKDPDQIQNVLSSALEALQMSQEELASAEEIRDKFAKPDFKMLFEGLPGLYMVMDPDLRIVAASDAYLQATMTRREEMIGRYVFDVFPDNPEDPNADAVRNSLASFNRVRHCLVADAMVVQRHDVRMPESEGGGFEVRYW
ncbi:MAG TPA: PAS domain-containing protein, partial [Methanotrichaceae archaeon]|nr:PAS domain-containing protein [Methanotrichaceae archaeon]